MFDTKNEPQSTFLCSASVHHHCDPLAQKVICQYKHTLWAPFPPHSVITIKEAEQLTLDATCFLPSWERTGMAQYPTYTPSTSHYGLFTSSTAVLTFTSPTSPHTTTVKLVLLIWSRFQILLSLTLVSFPFINISHVLHVFISSFVVILTSYHCSPYFYLPCES